MLEVQRRHPPLEQRQAGRIFQDLDVHAPVPQPLRAVPRDPGRRVAHADDDARTARSDLRGASRSLESVRTASKSNKKPPTTSSDEDDAHRWREGAAAPRDAEIAPSSQSLQPSSLSWTRFWRPCRLFYGASPPASAALLDHRSSRSRDSWGRVSAAA